MKLICASILRTQRQFGVQQCATILHRSVFADCHRGMERYIGSNADVGFDRETTD